LENENNGALSCIWESVSMSTFCNDYTWQMIVRDKFLFHFYKKYAQKFKFHDDDMDIQEQGFDTTIYRNGKYYKIEEKIVRNDHGRFFLETYGNVKTGKQGWLYKTKSDFIFYVMTDPTSGDKAKLYIIPTKELQEWFTLHEKEYYLWEGDNGCQGYLVPIKDVPGCIGFQLKFIGSNFVTKRLDIAKVI